MLRLWQTICRDHTKKYILPSLVEYIDKMLLERIPLAGIVRVSGVSKKKASGLC